MPRRRTLRARALRLPDALFLGGSVAAFLLLLACVATALRVY